MKKFLMAAAVGLLATAPVAAFAEEHGDMVAPAPAATPADAAASAATEAAADTAAVEVKEVTLKDGTKVVIEGDMVSVVGADGAKTPAPDGDHEMEDGTMLKTMGGKVMKDEAAPAMEAPAEAPAAH